MALQFACTTLLSLVFRSHIDLTDVPPRKDRRLHVCILNVKRSRSSASSVNFDIVPQKKKRGKKKKREGKKRSGTCSSDGKTGVFRVGQDELCAAESYQLSPLCRVKPTAAPALMSELPSLHRQKRWWW